MPWRSRHWGCWPGNRDNLSRPTSFWTRRCSLFQELQDPRQEALILRDLGNLARQQGHPAQAELLYTEALTVLARLGDEREAAITRAELGRLARQQGRVEEAESLLQEALSALRHSQGSSARGPDPAGTGAAAAAARQREPALRALLGAGVGLALVCSPETSLVEEQLEHLRVRLGEAPFLATSQPDRHRTPGACLRAGAGGLEPGHPRALSALARSGRCRGSAARPSPPPRVPPAGCQPKQRLQPIPMG